MAQSNSIRVGTIENSGPNTLVSYLRNASSSATQIDIAVAFITAAGLESVLHLLKRTSANGHVRLLTGLYQGFTETKALRMLLREQQQSNGRFLVQISTVQHFHWKTYYLIGRTTAQVVIGSSNLTDDGLRQSGEYNAVLSMQKTSKPFQDLHGVFQRHWEAKSRTLTEESLEKYEAWRASKTIVVLNRKVPLGMILQLNRKKARAGEKRTPLYWRTCIDGELSAKTQTMLHETTDWDRRGYSYINNSRDGFGVGDRVVFFDLGEKNVTIVEIKDTTVTPTRTPDGSYFAAYRQVRGAKLRKLLPKRWKSMKAAGLIRIIGDVHTTRRLSAKKFEAFVENLNETAK